MLIGTVSISSPPLAILIYAVLILILASAIASVVLRDALYAVGAFAATMVLVAILYLTIASFTLFAVQLVIFSVVSALLVVALLRDTSGLARTSIGPLSRDWIVGGAVSAAVLALLCVVVGVTAWPARQGPTGLYIVPSTLGRSIFGEYEVGLAVVVILLASGALGAGLILRGATPPRPSTPGAGRSGTRAGRPPR